MPGYCWLTSNTPRTAIAMMSPPAPAAALVAGSQLTCNRRAKRWIERVSAGPNASANSRQPPAWIASKPVPLPT